MWNFLDICDANFHFKEKYGVRQFYALDYYDDHDIVYNISIFPQVQVHFDDISYTVIKNYQSTISVKSKDLLKKSNYNLISIGEMLLASKDLNIEKLSHLRKACQKFFARFCRKNGKIHVVFFNLSFYIEALMVSSIFYEEFFYYLIQALYKDSFLYQKKRNTAYQECWQYFIEQEFDQLLKWPIPYKMNRIQKSFSCETLQLYQAKQTLYELRNKS